MFLTKLLSAAGDVEGTVSDVVSEVAETSESTASSYVLGLLEKTSEGATLMDKLLAGVQVALIGMAVVFTVLLLLMAILYVFKLVATRSAKPKAEKAPVASQPVAAATENEEEISAVVTAAVAAMNNKSESGYKVISIKKIVE